MDKQALTLLVGLGLGAGLMYLLDPHRGPQRRARLFGSLSAGRRQVSQLPGTSRPAFPAPHDRAEIGAPYAAGF